MDSDKCALMIVVQLPPQSRWGQFLSPCTSLLVAVIHALRGKAANSTGRQEGTKLGAVCSLNWGKPPTHTVSWAPLPRQGSLSPFTEETLSFQHTRYEKNLWGPEICHPQTRSLSTSLGKVPTSQWPHSLLLWTLERKHGFPSKPRVQTPSKALQSRYTSSVWWTHHFHLSQACKHLAAG